MKRLGIERHIVDSAVYANSVRRFREAGIVLPTFAELAEPSRIPAGVLERLASVELFDVYAGPGTPEGMKSLAFALQFQHPERTLTEAEVQAVQDRMVGAVAKECGGKLRER